VFKLIKYNDPYLNSIVRADREHRYNLNDGYIIYKNGAHFRGQAGDDCIHGLIGVDTRTKMSLLIELRLVADFIGSFMESRYE
jgi:hypothetical protein